LTPVVYSATESTEARYARLPFSVDEYRRRELAVRAEMERRDIDVLFVMSPANVNYLTGFEAVWYPPYSPRGVVVRREEEGIVFHDYERHRNHALQAAHWDEAFFYDNPEAFEAVLHVFADRGWTAGSIGMEWHTTIPYGPVVRAVGDGLAERGSRIVSGEWVVDQVRLLKSEPELECVRRAAEIVDTAFHQLPELIRPGMTEIEVEAELAQAMARQGGERAAIRTMVSAGPLVWCQDHFPPSRRPLERGDILNIDTCGVFNCYHVDLCRTFAIGEDHARAREILDYTARSVELVAERVRVGDPLNVAQEVADDYIFARFSPEEIWWVGGYALGIAFPPSWTGHTYLSNDVSADAAEQFSWQPGYLSNYENILFDQQHGVTASYIDSLLMTDSGIEILATFPRTLAVIP
jgi:Xaa-Pro aminopeptidase